MRIKVTILQKNVDLNTSGQNTSHRWHSIPQVFSNQPRKEFLTKFKRKPDTKVMKDNDIILAIIGSLNFHTFHNIVCYIHQAFKESYEDRCQAQSEKKKPSGPKLSF